MSHVNLSFSFSVCLFVVVSLRPPPPFFFFLKCLFSFLFLLFLIELVTGCMMMVLLLQSFCFRLHLTAFFFF